MKRPAAPDQKSEAQEHPRRKHIEISTGRQNNRDTEKQYLRNEHDAAAVEIIGKRACGD